MDGCIFSDLGCDSATDRRRCPCSVVVFHLPIILDYVAACFLGEAVCRRSFVALSCSCSCWSCFNGGGGGEGVTMVVVVVVMLCDGDAIGGDE